MAVGIVLLGSSKRVAAVRWAARIAKSQSEPLVIIEPKRPPKKEDKTDGKISQDLQEVIDELLGDGFRWNDNAAKNAAKDAQKAKDEEQDQAAAATLALSLESINSEHLLESLTQCVEKSSLNLVILPRDPTVRSSSRSFSAHRDILSTLPCEISQLVIGTNDGRSCSNVLVPTSDASHSILALRRANEIADVSQATVTSLFVEPNLGDDATAVGERILDKTLKHTQSRNGSHQSERKVVLSSQIDQGILDSVTDQIDLIVLGKQPHGKVYRFLFKSISECLIKANPGPAILVVQPKIPFTGRVVRAATRFVQANVPQIARDRRVQLVEKIQSSSQWDFDFVALICLSTLIAAGGLIQNSSAVVIGAMLVAPLMTPLLGSGLSLVQGNSVLFRSTIRTVLQGFLLSYVLGCLLGFVAKPQVPTAEMIARGSPGILDLVVALISGIAAAYAIGRPNLLSALPGVAIAASLIPPIATSGIATVLGKFDMARGAAVLFLTNIVAIILGTAISFWAIGIRGTHGHSKFRGWVVFAGITLVCIAIALVMFGSIPNEQVPSELLTEVNQMLKDQDASCESIQWVKMKSGASGLRVILVSSKIVSNRTIKAVNDLVGDDFEKSPKILIQTKIETLFD